MKLSWSSAPGKVQRYLVTYTPVAGGETKEVTLRGDITTTVLKNLEPGTRYDLSVTALYASGAGDALSGQGDTLEGKNRWISQMLVLMNEDIVCAHAHGCMYTHRNIYGSQELNCSDVTRTE